MVRRLCAILRMMFSPFTKKTNVPSSFDLKGDDVSDYIKKILMSDNPVMIARFGSVELNCITGYANSINIKNCIKYILNKTEVLGYGKSVTYTMRNNAGFFPPSKEMLNRFSQLMINVMPCVDILGSWQTNENNFKKELQNALKVPLCDLEPYYHKNPWSEMLQGKKVLVIHPFEDSIREQYNKREYLFKDKRVLPEFKLDVLKAVQSLGNAPEEFKTWFDALDYMKKEIDQRDFEIAIIGCGAYGFPLAAYVKSIGKKAIHLGGATQMLFGIKGQSWEDNPVFHHLINEHWIKPKESERPTNYLSVENGRYW